MSRPARVAAPEPAEISLVAISPVPEPANAAGLGAPGERLVLPPAHASSAAPLPFDPILMAAGANVAARSIARRLFGWKRYRGSVEAICHAAIAFPQNVRGTRLVPSRAPTLASKVTRPNVQEARPSISDQLCARENRAVSTTVPGCV